MKIKIAEKVIDENSSVFIIAEIANSHEGSLKKAKQLIQAAAATGANAIKLQKFVTEELLVSSHPQYHLFKKLEFNEAAWKELFEYGREFNLPLLMDVFDIPSANFAEKMGVDGYKIHSTDVANPDLLGCVAKKKKPIFLGVGATTLEEIEQALSYFEGSNVTLMHGYQAFPTKIEETHLAFLKTLGEKFQLPVGVMDHVDGEDPLSQVLPLVAIGFGASVIEKHITLSRKEKGIDYESALEPETFKEFVTKVRQIEQTIGKKEHDFSEDENKYRQRMKKSIVAREVIPERTIIQREMLAFKRGEGGISPMEVAKIVGRISKTTIQKDESIKWNQI